MISTEIFDLIYYSGFYFNILCFLIGIVLIKYQAHFDKIIICYLILSVTFDFTGNTVREWLDLKTNLHIGNVWYLVEFGCLFFFYYSINEFLKYKIQLIGLTVIFLLTYLIVFIFFVSIYEYTNIFEFYGAFHYSFVSIFVYYVFLKKLENRLTIKSVFWYNTGIFIYFTGNILIFLLQDYFFHGDYEYWNVTWTIHNILTFIKSSCFLIGFYMNYKHSKINEAQQL